MDIPDKYPLYSEEEVERFDRIASPIILGIVMFAMLYLLGHLLLWGVRLAF